MSEALPAIFPDKEINNITVPLYNSLKGNEIINCNYIIINQQFNPDKLDTRELLKFISRGNNAFIAANYFSRKFSDTLKIKTDDYYTGNYFKGKDSSTLINKFARIPPQ